MATGQLSGIACRLRRAALLQDGGGMTDGQLLECFLGRRDEAMREATTGMRLGPISRDALRGPLYERTLLEVYLLLGDTARAVELLRHQLSIPSAISVPSLAADPHYTAIRGDPRFQALLR